MVKSPQSSTEIRIEPRIRIPPMVGVPSFPRWDWGPSARTYCLTFSSFSFRITQGPQRSERKTAVRIARAARNVM